jgi:hypothetical protein
MTDLLPREKGRPGRRRTVTASAWIARRRKHGPWHSHVYVGTGRVHVLTTATTDAAKALEFNRIHLLQVLSRSAPCTASIEEQLHLI